MIDNEGCVIGIQLCTVTMMSKMMMTYTCTCQGSHQDFKLKGAK